MIFGSNAYGAIEYSGRNGSTVVVTVVTRIKVNVYCNVDPSGFNQTCRVYPRGFNQYADTNPSGYNISLK